MENKLSRSVPGSVDDNGYILHPSSESCSTAMGRNRVVKEGKAVMGAEQRSL